MRNEKQLLLWWHMIQQLQATAAEWFLLRDGQIYTQLMKGDESRQAFFQDIIKTQGVLGGVQYEH